MKCLEEVLENSNYYYNNGDNDVTSDNNLTSLNFSLFVSKMIINIPYIVDTVSHHPDIHLTKNCCRNKCSSSFWLLVPLKILSDALQRSSFFKVMSCLSPQPVTDEYRPLWPAHLGPTWDYHFSRD